MNAVVVGIGAMGGGMARALVDSDMIGSVVGYDKSTEAVVQFYEESKYKGKAPASIPTSLTDTIGASTNVAVISLVNESQCEQVCFGGEENLWNLMPKGSCVVMTSTVTATWAKKADAKFRANDVMFVDCPVSGGPARAKEGDLTLMASGEQLCLDFARPVLDALAREVHVINGGAGGGSVVKCVHQLLAGVHICAAAEAMAMAAKAGIDVSQLYDIVNGAAGASWMFTDRGKRMLEVEPDVKSALAIFVKDLDIVYAEAKKLMSPIPVATSALQQFISGQSLGYAKSDDSQVVKVYENVTKVPVVGTINANSSSKPITCVENDYVTVLKSEEDGGASFISESPLSVSMSFEHFSVHLKLAKPVPLSNHDKLLLPMHDLCWESQKIRIYTLNIPSGETVDISYPFFYVKVTSTPGVTKTTIKTTGVDWTETIDVGTISWNPPTLKHRLANVGSNVLTQYVVELR